MTALQKGAIASLAPLGASCSYSWLCRYRAGKGVGNNSFWSGQIVLCKFKPLPGQIAIIFSFSEGSMYGFSLCFVRHCKCFLKIGLKLDSWALLLPSLHIALGQLLYSYKVIALEAFKNTFDLKYNEICFVE